MHYYADIILIGITHPLRNGLYVSWFRQYVVCASESDFYLDVAIFCFFVMIAALS